MKGEDISNVGVVWMESEAEERELRTQSKCETVGDCGRLRFVKSGRSSFLFFSLKLNFIWKEQLHLLLLLLAELGCLALDLSHKLEERGCLLNLPSIHPYPLITEPCTRLHLQACFLLSLSLSLSPICILILYNLLFFTIILLLLDNHILSTYLLVHFNFNPISC